MKDLIEPIVEVLEKKESLNFRVFLNQFMNTQSWYLISDYCIGDKNKHNDAVTFSLLLNHDSYVNIKDYIHHFAPKDIKKTRTISHGIIDYINSPVIYHFSIVIPRKQKLLSGLIEKEEMLDMMNFITFIIKHNIKLDQARSEYYEKIIKRIALVKTDLNKKSFNEKLFRSILLVSSLGASILFMIMKYSQATHIAWVSDRDAIITKYDGLVFDLMFLWYKLYANERNMIKLDPKFILSLPEESGKNDFDELIRIPDYLVGTLASINIDSNIDINNLQNKHETMLLDSFINSKNQATLKLQFSKDIISVYNFKIKPF